MDYRRLGGWRMLLVSVCTLVMLVQVECLKVSFFGASHIAMPMQEAKSTTTIKLRFRTHQEQAMLLLAAGRTDFCLIALDGGRVQFRFKVDDHIIELWSPKKLAFNDREWHDLAIQRYDTNVTLQIDEHFVRKTLPPRYTDFNIHFGVFLGGLGDFSESYIGSVENFRGCISDVYYNNINLLKRAKERTSHVSSVGVSWTCSPEFDANEKNAISFVDNDAYVVLAKPPVQTGESWSLEFRTIEPLATILYNGGPDFVGLEVVDGKLRLLVGKGSNAVELIAERNVADGLWHNISISYSPGLVELTLDDALHQANFAPASSNIIELSEEYYIGGIIGFRRKKASIRSLKAVEHSTKGCIRNLVVDRQTVGFPHFKVTQGLQVDCSWKYPCLQKSPCILSATCAQFGMDEFICECEQAFCIRADYTNPYKIFTRSDLPVEMEIVAVFPIEVLEGQSEFISNNQIKVLLDYAKYNILDGGVVFTIVQPPKYGRISIARFADASQEVLASNSSTTHNNKYFSLVDLGTDKVKYNHLGGEHFNDHLTIDMQLMPARSPELPDYIEQKHRFVLHANVTPVNDAPVLSLPPNKILRLTQGIAKKLGADLFQADDPDSEPAALMYSVLAGPDSEARHGQIEVAGKAVSTFSQADVNAGQVTYLINTQTFDDVSFELAVQVSDGIETSPAVLLPVSIVPLQLRMINNTGLMLVHKKYALITPWNLSFGSNSEDETVDVKYTIVQVPQFGNVQKLRTVDNSWVTVDSFTSDLIQLGHIRYIHNTDFPVQDEFKFIASFGQYKTNKFDFRLTFTKLHIGVQEHESLIINGTRETIITGQHLLYQTSPLPTIARDIIYYVVTPPKYGLISLIDHPESFAQVSNSFTQQDIDKNRIVYRTNRTSYSSFYDVFEFMVSVPECENVSSSIAMVYRPADELATSLSYQNREPLELREGERALLSKRNFRVLFNKFDYLQFKIATPPQNGDICQLDVKTNTFYKLDSFTLANLYLDDIFYCHDDSESTMDSVDFLLQSRPESDFQFVCNVEIRIIPVNDNDPKRMSDEALVFYVVRNQTKVLGTVDLKYTDPDLQLNDTNHLVFGQVEATNGIFFRSGIKSDSFTQSDIDQGLILFKHTEPDNGTASFVVSDGYSNVSGNLTIHASEPFIKILHRNASIVQEGKFKTLTSADLAFETNLNAKPEEIEYRVVGELNFGLLKIMRKQLNGTSISRPVNMTSIKNFTHSDLEHERLIYWNTEVASMDRIRYRVTIKGIWAESEVLIRIYPAAYWDLLQIHRNKTLEVEESTSVKISREILEILHPNISPGDISYLVTQSPQHGYLEIQSITSDDEYNCKVFDQSAINSEKMFYIQAGVNQSSDHFVFDVTNGITWLRGLTLKIIIIPESLYIQTQHVPVDEGSSVQLRPKDMQPYSEYYRGKILEFKIVQQPAFGQLKAGKSKVNRFTFKQLQSGQVLYYHDGSENATDYIRFIAIARTKDSAPFELWFDVVPVNDEFPQIVTNTGLQMWAGGRAVIRNTDLMAQDIDTDPSELTFLITNLLGGSVFRQEFSTPQIISNFTQLDVDRERIIFVHDPAHQNAQIRFDLTDGQNVGPEQTLYITTNPVSLELLRNDLLHVFPLTRKQVLAEQLQYKCSDQEREVRFVVTTSPQSGRLLLENDEDQTSKEVNEFTQQDIDRGRLIYEHTHSMVELKSNDSFIFNVTSKLATSLNNQLFKIEISVSSGGLLRFLPVPMLHLNEGDSAPVRLDLTKVLEYLETRAGIPSPELYIDSHPPSHGRIAMRDSSLNHTRFMLNDFTTGRVYYEHDHSDTTIDEIFMSVYLVQGHIFLCNLTVPVVIAPVNDHPFTLMTQSPQMSIVEGENRTISSAELLTEDEDTAADEIVYEVISGPTLGALVKLNADGIAQDIVLIGSQFTQADINANLLQYMHFGYPQSTTFYFKVSDGKFKPARELFNLRVMPVSIESGKEREIVAMQQGSNIAQIEAKHLPVETNAQTSRLVYNVTEQPRFGHIMVDDRTAERFGQRQLDEHRVSYKQTDMAQSNDAFKVNVYIPDTNHSASVQFDVNVIVEPIIKINGISINSADKIRLTSSILLENNPTQQKLNRYNPKITITHKPDHGRIRKIIRNSGDSTESLNDKDITSFTYKELKSGIVFFVARDLPDEVNTIKDYFEYTLHIKSVQPGQGFVPIEIHRMRSDHHNGIMHPNGGAESTEVDVASYEPFPLNYVVLIGLVIVVVVLAMIMSLLIRCRSRRVDKNNTTKDYPPPLPRPPDFMTLSSHPRGHYQSSDGGESQSATAASTPLPVLSSIPHCKVIPIDMDDSDSDDMMDMEQPLNSAMNRYPYGDDNDEWSSSCDIGHDVNYSSIAQPQQQQQLQNQQRLTNPLLRRNQYWV